MKIFGLKTCDSCRKALAELRAAGKDAELVDLRGDGIDAELLGRALERFGDALVNRRSTTWRGLSAPDRSASPEALLRAHPTLMKRPLVVSDDGRLLLGWTAETRAALGL